MGWRTRREERRNSEPANLCGQALHIVSALAVFGEVEAFALAFVARPQSEDLADGEEQQGRNTARPDQGNQHGLDLGQQLRRHVIITDDRRELGVIEEALPAEAGRGDNCGAQRADDPTDAVDPEHIERIIVPELVLHRADEEVADR